MENRILLFGASGFIGSKIRANYSNTDIINLRLENWKDSIPKNKAVWINSIGKAHERNGESTEQEYYFANCDVVKTIFFEFIKSESEVFIHISSIAALEELTRDKALSEEMSSNVNSVYGKSKLCAEQWLLEQNLPNNKKVIIVRPPMIHGEGDRGNLKVLYSFISRGLPYPLYSFDNKRSFLCIQNFLFFLDEIIKKKELLDSGVYHIADDEVISTTEIINIIQAVEMKQVFKINIPKYLIKGIARIGDFIPYFPLSSFKLLKLTSDLIVSNNKIKSILQIEKLPFSAQDGIFATISSYKRLGTK